MATVSYRRQKSSKINYTTAKAHKISGFEKINLFHITPCNQYHKMEKNRNPLTVVNTLVPSRELTFFQCLHRREGWLSIRILYILRIYRMWRSCPWKTITHRATNILENRREYGMKENTLQLLEACTKETHLICWEAFHIQVFRQKKVLIDELQIRDTKPQFELVKIPYILCLELYPVQHTSSYRTPRTHTKR